MSLTKQQQIAHLKEVASNSLRLTVKGAPHLSTIESVHTPSDASGTDSDGRTPTDLMTPRPGLNESGCRLRRGSYFEVSRFVVRHCRSTSDAITLVRCVVGYNYSSKQ